VSERRHRSTGFVPTVGSRSTLAAGCLGLCIGLEARYATEALQRCWVHPLWGCLTIIVTLLWSGLLNATVPGQGIVSIGSATLQNLLASWDKTFLRIHPELWRR